MNEAEILAYCDWDNLGSCKRCKSIRERLAAAESHLKVAEDTLRDDGWKLVERNCFGERVWVPPVRTSIFQKMFIDEHGWRVAAENERDELRAEVERLRETVEGLVAATSSPPCP